MKLLILKILFIINLTGLLFNNVWAQTVDFDMSVQRVTASVYSIIAPSYGRPSPENKGWNSNSHFVVTDNGVLVFDTGSSEQIGKEIIKAIQSVTEKPVRWVVNSHSHADHWLGNAAFVTAGAEIIASKLSMIEMEKDGLGVVNAFARMTKGATSPTQIAFPSSFVIHKEKRSFGGVDVEFIFANDGHSPGDVLMWLPKQKIIMGGDVLSSEWMPIMTHHGNVPGLIETLNAVLKLKPKAVLPGHGQITSDKSVKRDAEFLAAVWRLVKDSHQKGMKFEDMLSVVRQKFASEYSGQYKDFDSTIEYLVQMMVRNQTPEG